MAEKRVIKRRVIKRTTQTSTSTTSPAEIPTFLVVWLAGLAGIFLSASWVVPFSITNLHDEYFKPYLNALRWDESALWRKQQTTSSNGTIGTRVPWTHDWFACAESKNDGPIVDAFHPLKDPSPATADEAVDSVLYLGATILPQVLDPSLANDLKDYVLHRAEHVKVVESIPVLTHSNRKSFGLDLREDPSIGAALHGLANNPLLSQTLEGLLGENPAIVELSTITAHPGAKAQPWHADSNPNTMIYERRFAQMFTLLVPLQDTTHEMGATWICPGTHRCQPPPGYCNAHGFSIATTNGTAAYWRAGDALLYGSDTNHRGGAHVDWNGPPRTVLILTLTSRPSGHHSPWLMPHRTLPLGPVFGMRWDHWGLTWKQLQNQQYLKEFIEESDNGLLRVLRALGLYSLEHDQGWTFVQGITFGMMNDMMGYRYMDLQAFLKSRISPLLSNLPWFLQGRVQPIDDDYAPVPRYLSDVVRNVRNAAVVVNVLAGLLVGLTAITNPAAAISKDNRNASTLRDKRKVALSVFLVVYLTVSVLELAAWMHVSSQVNVAMGKWSKGLEVWENKTNN